MAEDKHESTRDLLDDLEGGWESPRPAKVAAAPAGEKDEASLHAELDAAVDRLFDTLDPPPLSDVDLASLDSGWSEDDDEDEEEEEEPEPELPDEAIDPVAYAAAKKAREERAEARRQKRRAKLDAKKAKRRARALAAQQKQKSKKPRSGGPSPRERERALAKARLASRDARAPSADADAKDADVVDEAPASDAVPSRRPTPRKRAAETPDARAIPWRLIVLLVVIVVAAAGLAAMLSR